MRIFVAGNSHLTHYTKIGAAFRGLNVCNKHEDADLILIAEDTPTNEQGVRNLPHIEYLVTAFCNTGKPVILMSQVPPGFCRKQNRENLYHYPETLRIFDSYQRACNPEYIIIGGIKESWEVNAYTKSFACPVFQLSYEEAEMAKIAVNTILRYQVEASNALSSACEKVGASWGLVSSVIVNDKRISQHSYLNKGRWQDSLHLLRDSVTLKEIEDAR